MTEYITKEQAPLQCPDCDNVGYYIVQDRFGEPEQVQCQFCYTEPNSIFNMTTPALKGDSK
jgi:hypothetical protein